jgi:hypothetical protein
MVQRGPGPRLGLPVGGVLLQAERVHALHVAPAGPAARPGGQHPGGHIAQLEPVAEEEVQVLGHLEREQVPRMAQQGPLERAGGGLPVAVGPGPGRAQMMGFPFPQDRRIQLLDDLGGCRDTLRGRPVQREIGPVDVAEDQAVVGPDRRLGVGHGVARQRG